MHVNVRFAGTAAFATVVAAELTDWVDFQESNELIARAEMVRAVREWLALDTTNNAGCE